MCPGLNDFWFHRSKPVTPCSWIKLWMLWTVGVHAYVKGNWVPLIDRDADPFFIGISALHFSIGT